jgi:peptide/nickel transport system ATP-binding protein
VPAPPTLDVTGLTAVFRLGGRDVPAVHDLDFTISPGETLALVGESGSGKSVTSLSIMGLLPRGIGRLARGRILFRGKAGEAVDLAGLDAARLRRIRGNDIGMIFQEPLTSLNPVYTVGEQIAEPIRIHLGASRREAAAQAVRLLEDVGIPDPKRRAGQYPHELSGGMRQRATIAMALACNPSLLIADEPTTALDVTIQAQILDLILELQREFGAAVVLITHDLGVVAETAHRVIVMYAGRKVEEAEVGELFARPLHPYTTGLMASIPRLDIMRGEDKRNDARLQEIPGIVPPLFALPPGCAFAPRCPKADDLCRRERPDYKEKRPGHWAACWHSDG